MDSLILTFNKEQMKTYQELLNQDNIKFNFDTTIKIDEISKYNFDEILSAIEKEALELLKFKKNTVSFTPFLSVDEIKEFIPFYYKAIRSIKQQKIKISSNSWMLARKVETANKSIADINKRYSYFLPYKAALGNKDEYKEQIENLDEQFKFNIQLAKNHALTLMQDVDKSIKICDIISDFFKKSSKATDEPKFKKFDAYDFFWSLEAFIEQIKTFSK